MRRALRVRTLIVHALLVVAAALLVVNASYLFTGVAQPWSAMPFHAGLFRRGAARLPWLRLPLPEPFLTGLDRTLDHERVRNWDVPLLGHTYPTGTPWYFVVSWALKTPVALLVLEMAGLALLARSRALRSRPDTAFLAATVILQLAYLSFLLRAQIGYRMALMLVPLVAVLVAAGLASAAQGRLWTTGVAALLALAVAESAPYLGNTLAFTNAFVHPKKKSYRYLAASSIDWGQNESKLDGFRVARGFSDACVDPVHVHPGVNFIDLNLLAGVAGDRQHRWVREHLEPEGHFRHTWLWFRVDPATYERFLEEDRRLVPREEDTSACGRAEENVALDPSTFKAFPRKGTSGAWILCLDATARADVGIVGRRGGEILVGRRDWRLRDYDRIRMGEEAWYRLEPGIHSLVVLRAQTFRGRLVVNGGPVRLWVRPRT